MIRAFTDNTGGYYEVDIPTGQPIPAWLAGKTEIAPHPAPVVPLKDQAILPLEHSDITFLRVTEAVAAGRTTWAAPDVAAFLAYRLALRNIATGKDTTSASLPALPPLPANV